MKLVLGYLYPSVMSQYGDRGNVVTIVKRCEWRGIDVEVDNLEVGDRVDPDRIDLFLVGGGADAHQRVVCDDLLENKGEGIRQAISDGAAAFAVCAAISSGVTTTRPRAARNSVAWASLMPTPCTGRPRPVPSSTRSPGPEACVPSAT